MYLAARVAGEVSEVESTFGEAFIERFFGVERCTPTACICLHLLAHERAMPRRLTAGASSAVSESARWSSATAVKQHGLEMSADMEAGSVIDDEYFGR